MKKKNNINFLSVALLLFYTFSFAPALHIHHHHHDETVAFSEADACERAIYYGIPDNHKQHISEAPEKCWLCDHYTIAPQILYDAEIVLSQPDFYTLYFFRYKSYHSVESERTSNRDPPFFA